MKELSEIIKQKRISLKLDINKIAKDLRIRNHYLQKIEDGDFALGNIYMIGYIRNYANYLKVDIKDYIKDTKDNSLFEEDKTEGHSVHQESTSPPLKIVAITIACIAISIVALIYLDGFDFEGEREIDQLSSKEELDKKQESVNKVNSFHVEIENISKNTNIIVTANATVELSIFDSKDRLVIRDRLSKGQKTKVETKDQETIKIFTNSPDSIEIDLSAKNLPS